jgi:fumarate hydratase class II
MNLYKVAQDVRFLASGPRCGFGEINIPQNEPGSSIMPGKVNPTQCESMMMLCIQVIANNLAVTIGNTQGNFQLNTFMPMIIYNVNQSVNLLADGMDSLNDKCVVGIKPNHMRIKKNLDSNLMLATSLNIKIGYDKASQIVKNAVKEGISLRESAIKLGFLTSEEYDQIVQPEKMI